MIISDPFPHKIVDDYYEKELFINMKDELKNYVISANILKRQTYIKDFINLPNTKRCVDSIRLDETDIKQFKTYRSFRELALMHEIIILVGELHYPIHDEIAEKILSCVTYIYSNDGVGTDLYDIDKNYVRSVKWKENRTLIFPGLDGITWHSYTNKQNSIRITQNTFLIKSI